MVMSELPPRPTAAARAAEEAAASSSKASYPPPLMSSYHHRQTNQRHHQNSRRPPPPVRASERQANWALSSSSSSSSSAVAALPSSSTSSTSSPVSSSSSLYGHGQRYDDQYHHQWRPQHDRPSHRPVSQHNAYASGVGQTTRSNAAIYQSHTNRDRIASAPSSANMRGSPVRVQNNGASDTSSYSPATSTTSTGSSLRTPPDLLLNGSTLPTGIYPAKGFGSWSGPDSAPVEAPRKYLGHSLLRDRMALVATLPRDIVFEDTLPSPPASPKLKPKTAPVDSAKVALPTSSQNANMLPSSSSRKRGLSEIEADQRATRGDLTSQPPLKKRASETTVSTTFPQADHAEKMSHFLKSAERLAAGWLRRSEGQGDLVTTEDLDDVLERLSCIGDAYFQGRFATRSSSQTSRQS